MMEFTYDPVPDLDAYLARIGYTGSRELTRENLNALVYAHQLAVPFESLDCSIYQKPISLEIPHLFEKVVEHRRGGYCFELNGLFVSLLRTFGFDAVSVMCRLVGMRPTLGPVMHRGCLIRLDGKQYFADVGFGGAMAPFAVELSPEHQTFYGETYWFEEGQEGWKNLKRLRHAGLGDGGEYNDEEAEVLYFAPIAFPGMDFNALNAITSAPTSGFSQRVWVTMRTADGYMNFMGSTLTTVKDRVRTDVEVPEEDVARVLKEKFNLEPCEYAIP